GRDVDSSVPRGDRSQRRGEWRAERAPSFATGGCLRCFYGHPAREAAMADVLAESKDSGVVDKLDPGKASETVTQAVTEAREAVDAALKAASDFIRERPIACLAGALALGSGTGKSSRGDGRQTGGGKRRVRPGKATHGSI